MKNIKKVLAVMTAVSAFAASSSAFAATTVGETDANSIVTFTKAAYTDGELTTGNSIAIDAIPAAAVNGEVTLLMLDYDAVPTNVADGDILYIDQATYSVGTNPFADKALGLKVDDIVKVAEDAFAAEVAANTEGTLPEKTYSFPVKLGYYIEDDFAIAAASIDVTVAKDASGDNGTPVSIIWGDITLDSYINSTDALAALVSVANKYNEYTDAETGKVFKVGEIYDGITWGDITLDSYINSTDALAALVSVANKYNEYTHPETEKVYKVGERYTINVR